MDDDDLAIEAFTDQLEAWRRNTIERTTGETLDQSLEEAGRLLCTRLNAGNIYSEQDWCEEAIRLCRENARAITNFVPPGWLDRHQD